MTISEGWIMECVENSELCSFTHQDRPDQQSVVVKTIDNLALDYEGTVNMIRKLMADTHRKFL